MEAKKRVHVFPMNRNKKKGERLEPLLQVLVDNRITIREIGEAISIPRQTVNMWIVKDDILLSNLEKIADVLNYNLKWEMRKRPLIEGEEPDVVYQRETDPNKKRLYAVYQGTYKQFGSLAELQRIIGIPRQTIQRWLDRDDIKLSHLQMISDAFDYDFIWWLEKKE